MLSASTSFPNQGLPPQQCRRQGALYVTVVSPGDLAPWCYLYPLEPRRLNPLPPPPHNSTLDIEDLSFHCFLISLRLTPGFSIILAHGLFSIKPMTVLSLSMDVDTITPELSRFCFRNTHAHVVV